MSYNTSNKKNEDGSYTLSYGKGKLKLVATHKFELDVGWHMIDGPGPTDHNHKLMKESKAAWHAWAKETYEKPTKQTDSPPTPPIRDGPPSRSGPPKRSGPPRRGGPPSRPKNIDFEFAADPFDPAYRYPKDTEDPAKRRQLTPLGVLVEISRWVEDHEIESKTPAFTPLIVSVHECLKREIEVVEP